MKNILFLLILVTTFSCGGCSAVKDATGEYVTEAVKEKIEKDVDAALAKRNLSVKEITHAIDTNNDGKITKDEVIAGGKDMIRDSIILEAHKYVEQKLTESAASKGDLDSKTHQFWLTILGLISTYLAKQIYSAKQDGKQNERLAVVEKLLGFPVANGGGPDPNAPNGGGSAGPVSLQRKV